MELVEEASLLKRVAGLLVEVGDVGFTLTIRGVGERQTKLGIGLMCLIEVQKYGITRRHESALAQKRLHGGKRRNKRFAF